MDTMKERNNDWFWTDLAGSRSVGRHAKPRAGRKVQVATRTERVGSLASYRAEYRPAIAITVSAIFVAALAVWGWRHYLQLGHESGYALAYSVVFGFLVLQLALASFDQVIKLPVPDVTTKVLVPVFNEDPELLRQSLRSLLSQSKPFDEICVVDDGSTVDYAVVRTEFELDADLAGVRVHWHKYAANSGKRHAHAVGARMGSDADVLVTIDSDAILDYYANERGLRPFTDERVQSVAGVLLLANFKKNLLTRATELWYVTSEMIDRSSMSALGSVLVNTGTLAFYRSGVIMDNLVAYESETFFGVPVQFSDDSMLTLYAQLRGRTVQQPNCFGFTAMPENVSHHLRQYLRWMRGMTIRTFWRFRYLPVSSYAYWQHLARWVQVFITLPLFVVVFIIDPIEDHSFGWHLVLVPLLVGYGRSLRYLTIRRYDAPWWQALVTYSLAPVVSVWTYTVLRATWWYAVLTCKKTGWGTRQHGVEVKLEA